MEKQDHDDGGARGYQEERELARRGPRKVA
jgi:hypothetical protein